MAVMEGTARLKTAQGEYDFAVDGGAVSTITLRAVDNQGGTIPAGSVITGGYIDVETAVTSGGSATVSINSEGAADLASALAPAALTTGRKDIIPDATGSATVKTTVARSLTITIATAALTAGKFRVVVFYK